MGTKFYTVQMGDNLSTIGQRLGIPWQEIARLNKLPNPNKLRPNDVLMIPDQGTEEDRLRVDAAKAEPAGQAAVLARPSQTPKDKPSPGFDVVDEFSAKTRRPDQPLPNQTARDITTPPAPGSLGSGSIENIKDTTKPYPPTPAQLGYPQFWTDFLDKELPTALQGATGPGSAFLRAASKLKDFAQYPYAEPNAARADFYRKAGRFGPSEDPNYTQVFQKENQLSSSSGPETWLEHYRRMNSGARPEPSASGIKPEPYQGPEMGIPSDPNDPFNFISAQGPGQGVVHSQTPMTVKGFMKEALLDLGRKLTGARFDATSMDQSVDPGMEGRAMQFGSRARPIYEANKRNSAFTEEANSGPGSSFAKGTTVSKGSTPQTSNPFSDAVRKGMVKRLTKHGHDVADQALKLAGMSFEGGAVPPHQPTTWDAGNPLEYAGQGNKPRLQPDRPGAATEDGVVGKTQVQGAGDVVPFQRPPTDQQKYDQAVQQQKVDQMVHQLLSKPLGSWTDADHKLAKQLLGEE